MSAPSALDGGALAAELARRVPAQRPAHADRRTSVRPSPNERRRQDALAALTRTHDVLCTQAVDASEIAAGLESAGLGDAQARTEYGVGNVFELAQLMFDAAPRRPAPVPGRPDPWHEDGWTHALRGVLYAAPGLLYVLALHLAGAGAAGATLLVATVLGSALVQGLALLGHSLRGRGDERAAGVLLRGAVLGGAPAVGLVLVAGSLGAGVPLATGVLAAGQVSYLVAATVFLVVAAERLLLLLLLPALGVAAAALGGLVQLQSNVLLLVLLSTLLATCGTAVSLAPRPAAGRPLRAAVTAGQLGLAVRHAGVGALTAALVGFVVVDVLTGHGSPQPHAVPLAMAPLIAGLGVADWLVHRLRSAGRRALEQHTSLGSFRRWAEWHVLLALLGYALVLAAVTSLIGALLQSAGRPPDLVLGLDAVALDVLGVALLAGAVLLSLGNPAPVLALGSAAVVLDTGLRLLVPVAVPRDQDAALAATHLLVALLLLAALVPVTRATYGQAVRHR